MTDNPITLFGDLGKPADTLIKKIAKAIGGSFKPHQIVRVAKAEGKAKIITAQAEAEAENIGALAEIEVQDIQRRALVRFIAEETKKQENIEAITRKAIPKLNPAAEPDNLDDDWIVNFFDKSRLVSDEQMQELWAKLLAGEANEPGSYSKRVIAAVSTLSKADAESFNTLCSFGWTIGDSQPKPLIFDVQSDIYVGHGLTFASLTELDAIGLISYNNLTGFVVINLPQEIVTSYQGECIHLQLPDARGKDGYTIDTGHVLLTQVGAELATVCNPRPIDGFKDYVLDYWKRHGCSIVGDDQDTTTD